MSPALQTVSAQLLPELEGVTAHEKWLDCSQRFPWYPLPWLMLAREGQDGCLQKAALWFTDEQRLYFHVHDEAGHDAWLEDQIATIRQSSASQPGEETVPTQGTIQDSEPGVTAGEQVGPEDLLQADMTGNYEDTGSNDGSSAIPALQINLKSQPELKADAPLFEPYHAVDYFASQGIKLDLSAVPKDKLESQLKSFTQWLKTMKKVTPTTAPAYADPIVEKQAVDSNTEKEVITEAMAEVLEKQGKFGKAAAIYEKLLLLHPEKGTLFAARIEDLKTKQ